MGIERCQWVVGVEKGYLKYVEIARVIERFQDSYSEIVFLAQARIQERAVLPLDSRLRGNDKTASH